MPYADPQARRDYIRQWMQRRRDDWMNGKLCGACGAAEQLQIDHIDPKGKIEHRVWGWTRKRREAELAKCQVLCSRCHHEKTARYNGWKQHGTMTMYRNQGCRCDECRRANTDYARAARTRARSFS